MFRKRSGALRGALLTAAVCICGTGLAGCGEADDKHLSEAGKEQTADNRDYNVEAVAEAVDFDHKLEGYEPLKKEYNFYFTYKTVHPWWDAVALGIEDAAKQYEQSGVIINYEYLAPRSVSARDQVQRLTDASGRNFDVIGVDVADVDIVTPVINGLIEGGQKVMTFSSSDASKEDGCARIAYVGIIMRTAPVSQRLSAGSLRAAARSLFLWEPGRLPVMKTEHLARRISLRSTRIWRSLSWRMTRITKRKRMS